MVSTFLTPTRLAKEHDLASLHLRRDQALPVVLATQVTRDADDGYAEGVVTNTRFGSFPHSTIIGVPWGSQIRASKVDTGSRGRTKQKQKQKQKQRQEGKDVESGAANGGGGGTGGKKRKADEALLREDEDVRRNAAAEEERGGRGERVETPLDGDGAAAGGPGLGGGAGAGAGALKEAVVAESGFVHVLPPTPENWTTSLPHRTQVVYTPDYSYILHRIRARPGSRLIEAGSGSGSFTHAAARAVFNGYPEQDRDSRGNADEEKGEAVQGEEGTVADTRDVKSEGDAKSHGFGRVFSYEFHRERHDKVKAEMVQHGLNTIVHAMHRDVYKDGFLVYDSEDTPSDDKTSPGADAIFLDLPCPWEALPHLTRESSHRGTPGALDPRSPVHICTFSPCIEQAQKTISALRRYDWIEIEMVEVQHKRIDVRREYTGLQYNGVRGTNAFAADVEEAVSRLRDVEQRLKDFHAGKILDEDKGSAKFNDQQQPGEAGKLPFNEGRLVHRTEAEVKTHTSYLVFAVLPRAWTEEDEALAQEKWSKHVKIVSHAPKSQRQLKKEAKARAKVQTQNGVKDRAADINEGAKDAA